METERFMEGRCDRIKSLQTGQGIRRRTNGIPYMSVSSKPWFVDKDNIKQQLRDFSRGIAFFSSSIIGQSHNFGACVRDG